MTEQQDVPLIAVLRDDLGDAEPENDRLTYVWLLGDSGHSVWQRMLAAVPFFYWRVGAGGSANAGRGDVKPLMDLTAPSHPVISGLNRSLLQWAVLDPMTMPVRASSRAYRSNEVDDERLHLEEAISFLRQAPVAGGSAGLSQSELDTLMARLSLRKQLLGGLVSERQAKEMGESERFSGERVRSRNWELLRQCAEKTGLVFEPLHIAASGEDYAMVWFALGQEAGAEKAGIETRPIWKLLNIRDPWQDDRLKNWRGPRFTRSVDENGSLLPEGIAGREVTLVPLAAYSLNYPRMPLLLIDFRDKLRIRTHEISQRTINQLTSGVLGVSHFANWYYFAGADFYNFIASRHGSALNQAARLDCYSQFRAALKLDVQLNSQLRTEMEKRVDSLSVNPLDGSAKGEAQLAGGRYTKLLQEASDGKLAGSLDRERRAELAGFGRSAKGYAGDNLLHALTFGAYTDRAPVGPQNLEELDRDRRLETNLNFLRAVAASNTQPEVTYRPERIAASVNELSALLPEVRSKRVRTQAAATLTKLSGLTRDEALQADCSFAIRAATGSKGTGILAKPRAMGSPAPGLESAK